MAASTSGMQLIPSPAIGPAAATATTTVTLETASSSNQQPQITDSLVLKLKLPRKVSWKEGTVDNEFMNKKSSKKCCIFHKEKPFDEDDSDSEGDCDHDHDHDHDHNNGRDIDDKIEYNHGDDGSCCNVP